LVTGMKQHPFIFDRLKVLVFLHERCRRVIRGTRRIGFAFGSYTNEILELLAERFGPAYRRVFSYYWNNCFDARMYCSYARTYWQDCLYEFYVPVAAHPSMNMQYYRIA